MGCSSLVPSSAHPEGCVSSPSGVFLAPQDPGAALQSWHLPEDMAVPAQGPGMNSVPGHPYLAVHQNVEPDPKHLVERPLFHPVFSVVFGVSVHGMGSVNGLPGCLTPPCNPVASGSWWLQSRTKIWGCIVTGVLLTCSLTAPKEPGCWHHSALCLSFPACKLELKLLLVLIPDDPIITC